MQKHESQMTNWQPIATAPKDGSVFWAYFNHRITDPMEAQGTCRWHNGMFGRESYWEDVGDTENSPPTHWMPLPEPPHET